MPETGANFPRRGFLKSSLGALATTVASGRGQAQTSSRLRVGVVGAGGRGCDLIRKLTTFPEIEIVALCDSYDPHLKQGLEYAGEGTSAFSDYAEMLAESQPNAVVIAVPLYLHFEMACRAVERGHAVYCEKTMCYSLEQAQELAARVNQAGVVFQVGLQRRANPLDQQALSMARTGMLGKISTLKCQWHRNNDWRRPVPVGREDPGWEALDRRLNWRLYREYSQGLMAELGSHQMQFATDLLGVPPRRVLASGGTDFWRDGREVEDNVFCLFEYEVPGKDGGPASTLRVTYSALQNNAYEGASELIEGSEGTLYLTQHKGFFYRENLPEEVVWSQPVEGSERNTVLVTSGKTLGMSNDPWAHRGKPMELEAEGDDTRESLRAFIANVQKGDPKTICDVETGLVNTALVLMANEAIRTGEAVRFPL